MVEISDAVKAVVNIEDDEPAAPSAVAMGKRKERDEPTNMYMCRQSRAKTSVGVAPKIGGCEIKRNPHNGKIVVVEKLCVGIKRGEGPTAKDLKDLDALLGKRYAAARTCGGKRVELMSTAAAAAGLTTQGLATPAAMEINATVAAVTSMPPIGLPVGLFGEQVAAQ